VRLLAAVVIWMQDDRPLRGQQPFPGAIAEPNDVDIILVMDEHFRLDDCPVESSGLFDHALAQARYGASIFWTRPNTLLDETIDDFISYWQIKRDGTQRGIVDMMEKEQL